MTLCEYCEWHEPTVETYWGPQFCHACAVWIAQEFDRLDDWPEVDWVFALAEFDVMVKRSAG